MNDKRGENVNIGDNICNFTVINIFYDNNGHKQFELRCNSCGNIVIRREVHENMKRCECYYDLTGKDIGFLHINNIEYDHKHRHERIWNCSCICGNNICLKERSILRESNSPKSCGCVHAGNYLVGKRFGKLTVIEYCGKENGDLLWKCRCDCGNIICKKSHQLKRNKRSGCDACIHNVEYIKKENYYECLIKDKNITFYIDLEDYEKVCKHNWYCSDNGYIKSTFDNNGVYLHRVIMDMIGNDDMVIDHKNHNKLDNRKINLRIASRTQNKMNSVLQKKKMIGIRKSSDKTWRAEIYLNYKRIHLGTFNNIDDAIEARKRAEEMYYGEYSYKNSMGEIEV